MSMVHVGLERGQSSLCKVLASLTIGITARRQGCTALEVHSHLSDSNLRPKEALAGFRCCVALTIRYFCINLSLC